MKPPIERCIRLMEHRDKDQMKAISQFPQCMEHQEHNDFHR